MACLLCVWLAQTAATVGDPVASKAEKAREHYEREDYEEALRLYRNAQVENPDSPRLHFNVGDALYKLEDYENALKEFEQALDKEGDGLRPQAFYNMGNAFFQQQQFQQAVEAYRQALELDHADQDAKVNLELALEQLQQQEQQEQQNADPAEEQEPQPQQAEMQRMDPEEAERLLEALKDREKQAQLRRFRARGPAREKDW